MEFDFMNIYQHRLYFYIGNEISTAAINFTVPILHYHEEVSF